MTRIMKSKFLISAGLLALLCALLSPAVRADGTGLGDLTITLPTISGSAGATIVVLGNLTNSSLNTLDFGSDSVAFDNKTALNGSADFVLSTIFGPNPSSIGENSTLTGVDLFSVMIANNAAPGLYNLNFYDLLGGTDAGCTLGFCGVQLGTIEFSVNVKGVVATPEPGTLLLLASGLLAALLVIRRATQ